MRFEKGDRFAEKADRDAGSGETVFFGNNGWWVCDTVTHTGLMTLGKMLNSLKGGNAYGLDDKDIKKHLVKWGYKNG